MESAEEYKHISVVQPLACPDMDCLKKLNAISSKPQPWG